MADGWDRSLIDIERLGLDYHGRSALREVSLPIRAGRITAVVGPSGCGKSSFLACLNRLTDLIEGARVRGRVVLEGRDIHDRGVDAIGLRRRVGMIFQEPNPFFMSVRQNIELPLREHGVRDRRRLKEITERVLGEVGLLDEVRDRLDAPAGTLSGGQQQRLCLARALALEPGVLLMDEPCSALDPIASETVERLIDRLRGRYTVVLVTHNLPQARRLADDLAVFWMRDGAGTCIEHGPADRLFDQPADPITAAYLSGRRG